MLCYRVFRENCVFFIIHCNPSLAYISLQEIFKALNAMCTVTPIGWPIWPISVQPIASKYLQERGGKIVKILGKKTQFSLISCNFEML